MNDFAVTSADIDRLVRLVMADLDLADRVSAPVFPEPQEAEATQLRLTSRLITLDQIRAMAGPVVRRVIVPFGAVITPLARDEFKKNQWELTFEGTPLNECKKGFDTANRGDGSQKAVLPISRLTVIFHGVPAEMFSATFFDQIRKTVPVETRREDCVMQAAAYLAEHLASNTEKGVIFTKFTVAASAVCNRKRSLRALIGRNFASLEKDAASIGANLLILDPSTGLFQARRMMVFFATLGAVSCPPVLQKGLES